MCDWQLQHDVTSRNQEVEPGSTSVPILEHRGSKKINRTCWFSLQHQNSPDPRHATVLLEANSLCWLFCLWCNRSTEKKRFTHNKRGILPSIVAELDILGPITRLSSLACIPDMYSSPVSWPEVIQPELLTVDVIALTYWDSFVVWIRRILCCMCKHIYSCRMNWPLTDDEVWMSVFHSSQVSVTLENFQDISLPIPGKEDLAKLHSSTHQTSLVKAGSCGEAYAPQGWIAFVMEYIKRCVHVMNVVLKSPLWPFCGRTLDKFKPLCFFSIPSWFWGPVVTLQDCLAAFFARDELKGKQVGVKLFHQHKH